MRNKILLIATVFTIFFGACKKGIDDVPETPTPPPTTSASQADLLKDSVFLYSKEVYLWNDVIPTYEQFNPRQYSGSTELEAASNVMNGIRKLQPLDRFSFVTTKESSAGLQTGADVDLGFFIKAASIDRTDPVDSVFWFVTYVYDQSSAGKAGVQRGWYISKINNTALTYSQASATILNEVFFGNTTSASFEFVKPDGSRVTTNLTKSSFISNSVLHKSVINAGGKKVGYLVFNQFFGGPSRTELNTAFSYFQGEGINELVVDLRYNPGGSTETQDDLANLIAPVSANNQVMYKYIFNNNLQQGNFPLLKRKPGFQNVSFSADINSQKFQKSGNLNLGRVFFIVTGSSASASELLINNLKPYMDVKLIGDTTYGKPVGFFPIDVFNYSIYPISFKTVNSAGSADYYNGFAPDKLSPDGVNKNWGDVTEPSLASALKYITTGSFRISAASDNEFARQLRTQKQYEPLTRKLEENKFSGMFIEKQRR
ncbi:MAG TPA: S41 family peptidase [Segetibacter sp.]|jgi:C-terminal processing protease CtpA/Prc